MTVLIPSYQPTLKLLWLIEKIKHLCSFDIVIVDDGSGADYRKVFQVAGEYGCTVLTHPVNRGKGRALKTGFKYIKEQGETEGVVCADSDGQHLPEDIIKISEEISRYSRHIILGSRHFKGKVPFRSRFGNTVTRKMFSFATGLQLYDTQTGLRGYPPDMLDWLCRIPGERFEYEMNMLLEASGEGYLFYESEIDTVYYSNNKSSHFKIFSDSFRVYLPLLKFSLSSVLSAALDFTLLMLLQYFTSNLLFSAVGARVCSSVFNYTLNKFFVFSAGRTPPARQSMPRYFFLVLVILAFNYMLLYAFYEILGIPLFLSKLTTESLLFLFSYWFQRHYIFKG